MKLIAQAVTVEIDTTAIRISVEPVIMVTEAQIVSKAIVGFDQTVVARPA